MRTGMKKLITMIVGASCAGLMTAQAVTVDVLASATTNYGISGTFELPVTLYGGETFDIKFDVTASEATHEVESGYSSANSPVTAWGLGLASGDDNNNDDIFNGDLDNGVAAQINNLRIENFLANGGALTIGDITQLSFDTVTITDAQSAGDRVTVASEGVTNAFLRLNNNKTHATVNGNFAVIDLKGIAGTNSVDEFEITVSTTAANNKWACNSIQVKFLLPDSELDLDPESLSLELVAPDASVDGTLLASIEIGSSSNHVEVLSLVTDSGFSAIISDSTLTPATSNETITVTYTNTGTLVYNGQTAESTLEISWIADGSGGTNVTSVPLTVTYSGGVVRESFLGQFGVPSPGAPEYLTSPLTVTNGNVTVAADGLATFRLAYDITADAGGSLIGTLGTSPQWGVSTGGVDNVMDPGDSATIDNIQIIDFNANGGLMTMGDIEGLSLKRYQITSGTESNDSGRVIANGITNVWVDSNVGPQFPGHQPGASRVDLHDMTGSESVSSFTVEGVSNTHRIFWVEVVGDTELVNSKLELSTSSLSMTLSSPATTVEGGINASAIVGTLANDVEILSLTADAGFSVSIPSGILGTENLEEVITVTYTNTGDLVNHDDTTNSTLMVTWTADGYGVTNTIEVSLAVTYDAGVITDSLNIFAAANTTYGVDTVASMVSEVETGPDGLATFQIAFDVIPTTGTTIDSGTSGGVSSNNSWGVGTDALFKGSAGEFVDGISNLRVTNFNANGGSQTLFDITDLSFESVQVVNGHSTHDRVLAVANGTTNNADGVKVANLGYLDLEAIVGGTQVTNVVLGVGAGAADQTKNKWSVFSMQIKYSVQPTSGNVYSAWTDYYGLAGDDAALDADSMDKDGYANLAEFALGMDPTVADAGSKESVDMVVDGGTNYLEYVHTRRSTYVADGLTYNLIDTENLVSGISPSTNAQDQVLIGTVVDGYEPVTNRYVTDDPVKFVELEVQQD